uniref:Pentatricopeptide repeat-containing protein At3g14580, mitochondrial n=1 Tax=Anthurium amnicola TaxID=1678845 RepID=A0A1D1YJV0_9ARAE
MTVLFKGKITYQAITDSLYDISSRRSKSSFAKFTSVYENDKYWFGRLDQKDWLAPNEVLKIFNGLRNPDLVVSGYRKVSSRKDYKPNEAFYSLLIDKLASAQKFDIFEEFLERIKFEKCKVSDDFFFKLIKTYGNVANHPEQAIRTLLRMPEFHCWPTVKTFNFVLNLLVCSKQFDVIPEVYLSAPRLGVALDTCCFNILIKGLCNCGKLDAAFSVLHEIHNQGCKPNVKTYSTLMHSLCKNDRVEDAFDLYEKMEADGCYPDTVTFNILISGLCRQGKIFEGMEFLKKMKLKGCYPNSGTYQVLLCGFLSSEQFVKAKEFMDLMLSEGSCPSFSSYKLLIQGLCDENLLSDAELVLKQMVYQGFAPRMGTWKKILECMFSRTEGSDSLDNLFHSLD